MRRRIAASAVGFAALLCVTGAPASSAPGQRAALESGAPLSRTFSTSDYGGATQNWAIVQDHRGVIYVGNVEDGVMEYDGVRWRRISTTNQTTVRSLSVDRNGRLYVGGVGEIGYLAPDATGELQYVSLLELIPEQDRDFADVWRTFATPEGVYFSTFKRLIRISADGVRVWNSSSRFHLAFRVRDSLFVREVGRGLLRLEGDELRPVVNGERFAEERVYAMLPWPGSRSALLIGTRSQGWFLLDGSSLQPWTTQADARVQESLLYGAIWLANGALAVSTLHGGVFVLDVQGRLLARLDKSAGLPNETVFELFQDRQGGLWLGLDDGLARVDISGPLTRFDRRSGLEGSVMSMRRHAGSLYVGTTQGLYRLVTERPSAARFEKVPDILGQTWAMAEWNGMLLVANLQGVFQLRDGAFQLVRPAPQVSTALLPSKVDRSRVFVGMLNGLGSMRFEAGRWIDEGPVAGMTYEVRTMAELPDGRLWLGTANSGIVRLKIPANRSAAPQIERFGAEHGLPRSPHHVYAIRESIAFPTYRGILRFDEAGRRFVPDERFASMFPEEPRQSFPIVADRKGRLWMHTMNDARTVREGGFAELGANGKYRWEPRPLREIAGKSVVVIHADDDGVVWFGGEDETVHRYEPRASVDYTMPYQALVRSVATREGSSLYRGAGSMSVPRLPFAQNALRFEFAAPNFGFQPNRFQVYLDGVDDDWSSWSTEPYRDYTNIHEGTYRFRVRAMNSFGTVTPEAVYDFRILPPWYRTWIAYLSYVAFTVLLLTGVSRWRSTSLRRRNQELADLVALRTEELSSANQALRGANSALGELSVTDSLTGLKNRRYLLDHIAHDVAAVRRAYHEAALHGVPPPAESDLLFLVVDIDHFKQVNDHYGHAAGDRVLEQFSCILQAACRESDTAVRWGGEEFMIVARFVSPHTGPLLAERVRAMTAAHIFVLDDGKTLRRTCSVGFASYPVIVGAPERFSWEQTIKLADQCLYEAKRSGRNAWFGVESMASPADWHDFDLDFPDLQQLLERAMLRVVHSPLRGERRTSAA